MQPKILKGYNERSTPPLPLHINYTAIVLYLQNDLQYLPSGVVPDMEIEMSCFDDTVNKYNVLRIG